jgi:cell division protein FtsN
MQINTRDNDMIKISLLISLILFSFTFGCTPSLEYRSLKAKKVSNISSPAVKEATEELNHLTTPLEKDTPVEKAEFSIPEEKEMDLETNNNTIDLNKHSWYLQVLASTNFDSAEEVKNKFKNGGFEVADQKALINGQRYLRILIGPFKSRSEATEKIHTIKATEITKEVPFPRYLILH